jgi:hypothetical protein
MPDDEGRAIWGEDYDVERWSRGGRDNEGHLIWYHHIPDDREQTEIRIVTLNFEPGSPGGEGDYRNYYVPEDRPLDPWHSASDPNSPYYDLDDLATNAIETWDQT